MISELIVRAQQNDQEAMEELIQKFYPLFKKYAMKLNYEDAYEDIVVYYIELIKTICLQKLNAQTDGVIVSYIHVSIINFYSKTIHKKMEWKREITFSDLTQEQLYYVEVQLAKEDRINMLMELNAEKVLNQYEIWIIYMIYIEGYTTADIARQCNRSRQAINQARQRAVNKIKNTLR